jgi:serine/threonine-protein kinase
LHSNIVPIFDFGKVGATYYLAQEYVSGRDVDHLVQRALTRDGKPPPLATTLHVAHAVLQALAYAHALADPSGQPMGLVHRDVSPNNVLVSSRGDVKLLDFGIVKATGRSTETRSGMVKGNVNCMSPEQAQGLAVDARADLFSLAMTLFRLASGTALYGAGTAFELLVRAAAGPTADDLARVRALGGPLAAALEKALQPDREKRFASATEFAAALPPAPPSAAAETGALVARLFAEELQGEQTRMDAVTPPAARASQ